MECCGNRCLLGFLRNLHNSGISHHVLTCLIPFSVPLLWVLHSLFSVFIWNHCVFLFLELQALGSHGNSAVEVDRETAERMGHIQASYRSNREAVLGELLQRVCDIKPEFHANYRVAGWVGGAFQLVGVVLIPDAAEKTGMYGHLQHWFN